MLYVIMGPTSSGKTEIAKKLSDLLNAPIISGDAFQVYIGMDIGTGKIKKSDPYYSRHYLLDILYPNQKYSIFEYQKDFRKIFYELSLKYKNIILAGGSGLYIKAALFDYDFLKDEKEIDIHNYDSLTNEELYKKLVNIDYISSKNIHPNNRKRIIRALNIASQGKTKSEINNEQEHKTFFPLNEIKFFFINPNREELYHKINLRVDKMIEDGLVNEVKCLTQKYSFSLTSLQGIGYKEIKMYLDGNISLDESINLIKKRSRRYAKAQITFFKHQFPSIEVNSGEQIIEMVKQNG